MLRKFDLFDYFCCWCCCIVLYYLLQFLCFGYGLNFCKFACSWLIVILQPDLIVIGVEFIWSLLNLEKDDITFKKKEDAEKMCFDVYELHYLNLFLTYLHILWINQCHLCPGNHPEWNPVEWHFKAFLPFWEYFYFSKDWVQEMQQMF